VELLIIAVAAVVIAHTIVQCGSPLVLLTLLLLLVLAVLTLP
jgi:hypothetical protein